MANAFGAVSLVTVGLSGGESSVRESMLDGFSPQPDSLLSPMVRVVGKQDFSAKAQE